MSTPLQSQSTMHKSMAMPLPLPLWGTLLLLLGIQNAIQSVEALTLSNLSVPRIIDVAQKAKLSCSYEMGNRTLNSVKWYKDGQEFFRYSPLTPPTTNWFPVKGVTIADGSSLCNQFMCNVELEKLNVNSSGQYRCEVSGDAPEFKLIDKAANLTVGVLPKSDPEISGVERTYQYRNTLLANCSFESSPAAKLTWYINNKTASQSSMLPVVYDVKRNDDGISVYKCHLQLRIYIDDKRYINKSEMLELRCSADIMGVASLRRSSQARTTILASKGSGHNQRLTENGACASARAATIAAWFLCIATLLRWRCTLS